jgi:hypothetical protein
MQIAELDAVVVRERNASDAGLDERQSRRTAESASSYY